MFCSCSCSWSRLFWHYFFCRLFLVAFTSSLYLNRANAIWWSATHRTCARTDLTIDLTPIRTDFCQKWRKGCRGPWHLSIYVIAQFAQPGRELATKSHRILIALRQITLISFIVLQEMKMQGRLNNAVAQENPLWISWHDTTWIPILNPTNVMDYFMERSNPFYDRTCNNEIVKMQRQSLEHLKSVENH